MGVSRRLDWVAARPHRMVLFLVVAQLVVWTAVPFVFHTSLPLDVVREGLAWGREWQWGYHKHPPLASWLVELSFTALGDLGPFVLSQLAIAATYAFVYRLGCELMEPHQAACGTLLLAGLYYFSFPTPEFNHNLAQMPVWACAGYAFYKAAHGGGLRWWLLLGATVGLGGLIKYSVAVLVAAMALYLLATPRLRPLLRTAGPYAAAGIALLVVAPHLGWLRAHGFVTLDYAAARAGQSPGLLERILQPLRFLLAQAADHLGMAALALWAGLVRRDAPTRRPRLGEDRLRFLICLGLGPAGLTAIGSLVSGFGLRDMWGAPMWNLSGLLAVGLLRGPADCMSAARLAGGVAALLAVVPAIYAVAATLGTPGPRGPRTAWPDRAIAAELAATYRAATGCPVRIVAGSGWLAGLVALRMPGRPSVLADWDFALAPWITPERAARQGLIAVWEVGREPGPPSSVTSLPGFAEIGTKQFAWPYTPARQPLSIGWGLAAPSDRANCEGGRGQ